MKETIKKALARNCSAKAFCVYGIFKRLEKAIDTLEAKTTKPEDNNAKTQVNNGDTTSVKTGDDVNMLGTSAGLALLSIAGAKVLRKKED